MESRVDCLGLRGEWLRTKHFIYKSIEQNERRDKKGVDYWGRYYLCRHPTVHWKLIKCGLLRIYSYTWNNKAQGKHFKGKSYICSSLMEYNNAVTVIKMGAKTPGWVDRALDSRSKFLGFNFHCWSCLYLLGQYFIPCYILPAWRNGYLVEGSMLNATDLPNKLLKRIALKPMIILCSFYTCIWLICMQCIA